MSAGADRGRERDFVSLAARLMGCGGMRRARATRFQISAASHDPPGSLDVYAREGPQREPDGGERSPTRSHGLGGIRRTRLRGASPPSPLAGGAARAQSATRRARLEGGDRSARAPKTMRTANCSTHYVSLVRERCGRRPEARRRSQRERERARSPAPREAGPQRT